MITRNAKRILFSAAIALTAIGTATSAQTVSAPDAAPEDTQRLRPMHAPDFGRGMRRGHSPFGQPAATPDFEELDADGNGEVTQDELNAFRAARIGGLDADDDGLISRDEIVDFEMQRAREMIERKADATIGARDVDGNGTLSAEEMFLPPLPARMFDRLDRDDDGVLSSAELERPRLDRKQRHRPRMMRGGPDGPHRSGSMPPPPQPAQSEDNQIAE